MISWIESMKEKERKTNVKEMMNYESGDDWVDDIDMLKTKGRCICIWIGTCDFEKRDYHVSLMVAMRHIRHRGEWRGGGVVLGVLRGQRVKRRGEQWPAQVRACTGGGWQRRVRQMKRRRWRSEKERLWSDWSLTATRESKRGSEREWWDEDEMKKDQGGWGDDGLEREIMKEGFEIASQELRTDERFLSGFKPCWPLEIKLGQPHLISFTLF